MPEHVPYADPFDPDMLNETTFTLDQIARTRQWRDPLQRDRLAYAGGSTSHPPPGETTRGGQTAIVGRTRAHPVVSHEALWYLPDESRASTSSGAAAHARQELNRGGVSDG